MGKHGRKMLVIPKENYRMTNMKEQNDIKTKDRMHSPVTEALAHDSSLTHLLNT